jgi:hypothetical protein
MKKIPGLTSKEDLPSMNVSSRACQARIKPVNNPIPIVPPIKIAFRENDRMLDKVDSDGVILSRLRIIPNSKNIIPVPNSTNPSICQ